MKAKFDYLEKKPVRMFNTAKNAFGCVVSEYGGMDDQHVLIVELEDINDKRSHEEIHKSVFDAKVFKKIKAKVVLNGETSKQKDFKECSSECIIETLSQKDVVIKLQQLFVDKIAQEVYFAIICEEQDYLHIGKIKYFDGD